MVWGIDAFLVPLLSPWVWVALAAGLALIGVLALRTLGRPSWPATLGVALLAILPLIAVAQSVSVPNTFQNGTTADAIEVNENFDTLIAELEDLRLRVSELEAQLLTPNACGGTVTLAHEPGDPCGSCGIDQYVCDGTESTICDGDTPDNACGVCSTLADPPGIACGFCLDGTRVCNGTEDTTCQGGSPGPTCP